ncbi:MAG: hypothetical protein ABDI19_00565 [Armatimonadota bacterium]
MRFGRSVTLWMIAFLVGCAFAQDETRLATIAVEAEGAALWRKPHEQAVREATRNALQQAIESACGVRLARLEVGRDGALQREAQLAFAQGVVLRWQSLRAPRVANGCVYVRVRAEVVPLAHLQTPADWREVWQTVGHPPLRLALHYQGDSQVESDARSALHAALLDALKEMGVQFTQRESRENWRLIAKIQAEPIKRWGDTDAPYGLGDLFASWRVRLLLQVVPPTANADPIVLLQREAKAVSCVSDRDAVRHAIGKALQESHADWRITLANLWIQQILNPFETPDKPDSSGKLQSHPSKEARNDAKNHANRSNRSVAANGRRAAPSPARR